MCLPLSNFSGDDSLLLVATIMASISSSREAGGALPPVEASGVLLRAFEDWTKEHGALRPADIGRLMRQQGYAPTQAELRRYAEAAEQGASAADFAAWCQQTGYKDPSFEDLISFFAPFDQESTGFVPARVFRLLLSQGEALDSKELDATLGEIRTKAGSSGEELVNYRDFVTLALER
ncbi:CAM1 [Symbiodinium natans]|uniref:CAM1 protein n=1 Tax=Symbiodinium natans TaxID=878477 RepID=A0A812LC94_9DINO|nr:CAM1 [Symbiodinium natans]